MENCCLFPLTPDLFRMRKHGSPSTKLKFVMYRMVFPSFSTITTTFVIRGSVGVVGLQS